MSAVLSVSQLNFYLRSLVEGDPRLAAVTVRGEITNYRGPHQSGYLFFSLKDAKAAIDAMMPPARAAGLRFSPENGMKVLVQGTLSIYEAQGRVRLLVREIVPEGAGSQAVALEQLKARLAAEGIFDNARPLPAYPARIGVITSPTGAALQDIRKITARRWPVARLILAPVLVQGENAPAQMVEALREMNRLRAADVILLGRGGGSAEDLSAFNDEALARAVAASEIPVVSAVGHETDFTLCDLAADLRAPTPSAAAELATPDGEEVLAILQGVRLRLERLIRQQVDASRRDLELLVKGSPLGQPEHLLDGWKTRLEALTVRRGQALEGRLSREQRRLAVAAGRLDALSPLKVLSRGYAAVLDAQGRAVTDSDALAPGDRVDLRFARGTARAQILTAEGEHHGEEI